MIQVSQSPIAQVIENELIHIRSRNPGYSMRALAQRLEINSGVLSQIISGKRRISKTQAEKIANKLKLDNTQRNRILEPFIIQNKIDSAHESTYTLLEHQKFKSENLWIVLAILNLLKTEGFALSAQSVSSRLGITTEKSSYILKKVLEQELIYFDKNGRACRSNKKLQTIDNEESETLQVCHQINCEMAKESVKKYSVEKRDLTSMTLAVDISKLAEAKNIIRKFQDELAILLETGQCTEVYKINVQLFPLTKI